MAKFDVDSEVALLSLESKDYVYDVAPDGAYEAWMILEPTPTDEGAAPRQARPTAQVRQSSRKPLHTSAQRYQAARPQVGAGPTQVASCMCGTVR